MSGRQCTTGLVKQFFPGEVKPGLDPNPQVTPASLFLHSALVEPNAVVIMCLSVNGLWPFNFGRLGSSVGRAVDS